MLKIQVLDEHGFVELVDYMGEEDAVVDAARVSFDKLSSQYTIEENTRLLNYLIKHEHGSPFEMVEYKFRVQAPVVVWWQWVRHRMASMNFISGRYVSFDETVCYKPTQWRVQSTTNKQGSEPGVYLPANLANMFSARRDRLYEQAYKLYQDMLKAGVAKEEARLCLPFAAVHYQAIWKVNARSLMNFLHLRLGADAQEEIRLYANAICSIVRTTHPTLFKGDIKKL